MKNTLLALALLTGGAMSFAVAAPANAAPVNQPGAIAAIAKADGVLSVHWRPFCWSHPYHWRCRSHHYRPHRRHCWWRHGHFRCTWW